MAHCQKENSYKELHNELNVTTTLCDICM